MNNEGSTILVTGATGTVGSEVVRQLSTKGQIIIRAAGVQLIFPLLRT